MAVIHQCHAPQSCVVPFKLDGCQVAVFNGAATVNGDGRLGGPSALWDVRSPESGAWVRRNQRERLRNSGPIDAYVQGMEHYCHIKIVTTELIHNRKLIHYILQLIITMHLCNI